MTRFTTEHKRKISLALRGKKHLWAQKPKISKVCPCGKTFFLTPGQVRKNHGKYCCRLCYYKYRIPVPGFPRGSKRPPFSPEWCAKISKKASNRIGNKNSNWKGGLVYKKKLFRATAEYKQWRKDVYERDGYRCIVCGAEGNGKNLEAHHIVPLSILIRNKKSLFDLSNGQTLCSDCHKQTETYGWRVWNYFLGPYSRRWCQA